MFIIFLTKEMVIIYDSTKETVVVFRKNGYKRFLSMGIFTFNLFWQLVKFIKIEKNNNTFDILI
jgi:hypothetical protein